MTKQLDLHTVKPPREAVREFLRWTLESDQAAETTKGVGFTLPPSQ